MTEERLSILLGISIIPAIFERLVAYGDGFYQELDAFYRSGLYRLLSNPETALWHLSPATLASMYMQERETGHFDVPEEQS